MKKVVIVFFLFQFFLACNKEDNNQEPVDQLPAATKIGANTAGCYINGQLLIPKNGINSTSGYPVYGLTVGGGVNFKEPVIGDDYWFMGIANLRNNGVGYTIYLHLNDMTMGEGTYNIGQSNGDFLADGPNNPQIIVSEVNSTVYTGKAFYSGENAGTITITRFDYPNGIYSGIFSATLYNKDNPDETIQVTDGRFDIKLATLNH